MRNEQSCPQAPSEARDKAHAQARRQRACGVQGQSPQRSMRQSLIRRKPTRCRLQYQKHIEVKYQIKVISEYKICTAFLSHSKTYIRKERSDFAEVGLAQITVGANSVRPCSEFVIISELQGSGAISALQKSDVPTPSQVFVHLHDFMVNSNLVTSSGLSHFCELANRNFAKPLQC